MKKRSQLVQSIAVLSCLAAEQAAAPVLAATPAAAAPLVANTAPGGLDKLIYGHAIFNAGNWQNHLQQGLEAIERRQFDRALAHLNLASEELRRHAISDARFVRTRLALAEANLGDERLEQAQRLFTQAGQAAAALNERMLERASQTGLAETLLALCEYKRAGDTCRRLLANGEPVAGEPAEQRARQLCVLAAVLSHEGLTPQAQEAYRQSLDLLEAGAGDAYLLAQTRYRLALELQNGGRGEQAAPLFEKAFAELDRQAHFESAMSAAPRVVVRWDAGSPRSRQIADPEYPLKYVLVRDLRVAATAVRSENVVAVLISLANCGRFRIPLYVGPVAFLQLKPHRKQFLYVPPEQLDTALEAEHVTELTWRRRWLNHIEKNRYIPGFLKNRCLDADNFFSNNTFGDYGNWGTIACNETPIVTREQFYFGFSSAHVSDDPATVSFLSRSRASYNYRPTYIDPGEAKTGLVFFKQERFDRAQLNVIIGNTVVEIPIDTEGPRR